MSEEWWDDAPLFKSKADRLFVALAQLRPIEEWFSLEQLLELREQLHDSHRIR